MAPNPATAMVRLNQFNPFKDLTATTCTGVKNYVANVIKAANVSGASMNAMLKAQMLATAQGDEPKLIAFRLCAKRLARYVIINDRAT